MFQNGLLATFIPEILMVIGFVLCLLASAFKAADSSSAAQVSVVAQVISFEQQKQNSVYQVSVADFEITELVSDKKQFHLPFVEKTINFTSESQFSTSDGLSYVDFSRPPPAFLS